MFFCKYLKTVLSSFILILISACSQNNSPTMTEKGVGAGAVIGAGVGALVGATAGEAGAGVVLGSVAGATSGGIIGSSMEGSNEEGDSRNSLNNKQNLSSRKASNRTANGRNTSKNSNRSQLASNAGGSFLGKYIWDRAPEGSYLDEDEVDTLSYNKSRSTRQLKREQNLPSGSKGVAAKFAQIKPKALDTNTSEEIRDSEQLREELGEEINAPRARLVEPPLKKTPTIDLIKPKEVSELPKAVSSTAMKTPVKSDLPPAKSTIKLEKSSSELASVTEKKQILTPTLPKVEPKKEEKLESTKTASIGNTVDQKNAITNLPPAKKSEEPVKLEETTRANTAKLENNSSKCSKGESEIQRAKNSPSDSDKVFYLRRAILSCPQNASLKVELGKVYKRLGLKEDARREFNNALETDPSNATAEEELSIMMLEGSKN